MKKLYTKPEADKISFNYRDQVVAASSDSGSGDDSFVQTVAGIGSPICGGGGLVDRVFDYAGSTLCA